MLKIEEGEATKIERPRTRIWSLYIPESPASPLFSAPWAVPPFGPQRLINSTSLRLLRRFRRCWGLPAGYVHSKGKPCCLRNDSLSQYPRWKTILPFDIWKKPHPRRPSGSRYSRIAQSPSSKMFSVMHTISASAKSWANISRIAARPTTGSRVT